MDVTNPTIRDIFALVAAKSPGAEHVYIPDGGRGDPELREILAALGLAGAGGSLTDAVTAFQQRYNAGLCGCGTPLVEDGKAGPLTLAALQQSVRAQALRNAAITGSPQLSPAIEQFLGLEGGAPNLNAPLPQGAISGAALAAAMRGSSPEQVARQMLEQQIAQRCASSEQPALSLDAPDTNWVVDEDGNLVASSQGGSVSGGGAGKAGLAGGLGAGAAAASWAQGKVGTGAPVKSGTPEIDLSPAGRAKLNEALARQALPTLREGETLEQLVKGRGKGYADAINRVAGQLVPPPLDTSSPAGRARLNEALAKQALPVLNEGETIEQLKGGRGKGFADAIDRVAQEVRQSQGGVPTQTLDTSPAGRARLNEALAKQALPMLNEGETIEQLKSGRGKGFAGAIDRVANEVASATPVTEGSKSVAPGKSAAPTETLEARLNKALAKEALPTLSPGQTPEELMTSKRGKGFAGAIKRVADGVQNEVHGEQVAQTRATQAAADARLNEALKNQGLPQLRPGETPEQLMQSRRGRGFEGAIKRVLDGVRGEEQAKVDSSNLARHERLNQALAKEGLPQLRPGETAEQLLASKRGKNFDGAIRRVVAQEAAVAANAPATAAQSPGQSSVQQAPAQQAPAQQAPAQQAPAQQAPAQQAPAQQAPAAQPPPTTGPQGTKGGGIGDRLHQLNNSPKVVNNIHTGTQWGGRLLMAYGAYKDGKAIYNASERDDARGDGKSTEVIKESSRVVGGWSGAALAGAAAGAAYGAAVGTLIPVPFAGTAGGALLGTAIGLAAGAIGYAYGSDAGLAVGEALAQ